VLLRIWWFVTLLLAALGLTMGGAHLLELPVRMGYDPQLYMRVTSTIYLYFGLVGAPIQILALLCSVVLAWLVRGRAGFPWALAGAVCLALSILLWFLRVQPANTAWAEALRSGPAAAVEAYARLRGRWEYGHVMAFSAWLLGFALLLYSTVREIAPASRRA
jgi:hypothetical protein